MAAKPTETPNVIRKTVEGARVPPPPVVTDRPGTRAGSEDPRLRLGEALPNRAPLQGAKGRTRGR